MSADLGQPSAVHGHGQGHRLLLLVVSSMVILGSAATVAYSVVFNPSLDRPTYNIIVALVCFMASSVSALLFASSNIQLKGNIGVFAVTLGGPATMWLIAFAVITRVMDAPLPQAALEAVKQAVLKNEEDELWMPFQRWREGLGDLGDLFKDAAEEDNLQFLLSGAYIQGSGRDKLQQPLIDTLFVYASHDSLKCENAGADPSIKFQRIRGSHAAQAAQVFVTSNPTTPNAPVRSVILSRAAGRIRVVNGENGPWLRIPSKPVDVLVIASYCEPVLVGDWIHVHTLKYMNESDRAHIKIGIVTQLPLSREHTSLWELRGASFRSTDGAIPLLMRRFSAEPRSDVTALTASLGEWMPDLERLATDQAAGAPERAFISSVLSAVREPGKGYFESFAHRASYDVASSNSTIMTFMWQGGPPAPAVAVNATAKQLP